MIRKYSPVVVSLLLWILLVCSCGIEWHDGPGPEGQPGSLFPRPMDSPTPTSTPISTRTPTPTPAATPEAAGQLKQVQE